MGIMKFFPLTIERTTKGGSFELRIESRGSYFFVTFFLSFSLSLFFNNVDKGRRVEQKARLEKEEEGRLINSRCPLPVTVTRVSLVS